MHVEKRATNKFGLFLLALAVIALIAGGAYYFVKHKGNIDLNIKLPWQKETEEEKANSKSKNKSSSSNDFFITPIRMKEATIDKEICKTTITKYEDKSKEFIIYYTTTNEKVTTATTKIVPCEIHFYKYAVNGFLIPGESKLTFGEEKEVKEGKIVLKKAELEANEVYGIRSMKLFYSIKNVEEDKSKKYAIDLSFTNSQAVKDIPKGVLIAESYNIKFYYYKTIADKDNNYIYFIIENKNELLDTKIKVKKLLVNDLIIDTADFEEEVFANTKSLVFIELPKKKIPTVNKFTISFFNIIKTKEGKDSFYITTEYDYKS